MEDILKRLAFFLPLVLILPSLVWAGDKNDNMNSDVTIIVQKNETANSLDSESSPMTVGHKDPVLIWKNIFDGNCDGIPDEGRIEVHIMYGVTEDGRILNSTLLYIDNGETAWLQINGKPVRFGHIWFTSRVITGTYVGYEWNGYAGYEWESMDRSSRDKPRDVKTFLFHCK